MISDRIAVLQMKVSKRIKVTFINVYSPHMGRSAEETEAFYDTLQQTIQRFRQQLFFILGDFNAKIGQKREGATFLRLYSRRYKNSNGFSLRDFCADNDLFLSNTAFYKKEHVISQLGKAFADGIPFSIRSTTSYSHSALNRCSPIYNLVAGHLLIVTIGSRPPISSCLMFTRYSCASPARNLRA